MCVLTGVLIQVTGVQLKRFKLTLYWFRKIFKLLIKLKSIFKTKLTCLFKLNTFYTRLLLHFLISVQLYV